MSSTTTACLTSELIKIINEVEHTAKVLVIGACSDNAPNIANVFSPIHKEGLAQVHHKYILRVPCQAHTANLVNVTYLKNNPYYNQLRSKIKCFATKAAEKRIHVSLEITRRCPMIREQRWYTEYEALYWIIQNRGKIERSWSTIKDDMGFDVCPITDELELLLEALKPIRYFVLDVEVNVCSIGNAWNHFTRMKTELERLSTKNKFAKDLLEIVNQRWSRGVSTSELINGISIIGQMTSTF